MVTAAIYVEARATTNSEPLIYASVLISCPLTDQCLSEALGLGVPIHDRGPHLPQDPREGPVPEVKELRSNPFHIPLGGDVHELARKVYRGLEHKVRSARIWGHGVADGQNVHLDHVLHDKDIVELHS